MKGYTKLLRERSDAPAPVSQDYLDGMREAEKIARALPARQGVTTRKDGQAQPTTHLDAAMAIHLEVERRSMVNLQAVADAL